MKIGRELINDINNAVVNEGKAAFWWLGQMGYAIKLGNTVIYIDAYLRENPKRTIPPLFKPEEVDNADIIMGTHDHSDHIDRLVWKDLSIHSPNAKFYVPDLVLNSVSEDLDISRERFVGMDDGMVSELRNVKITGIASAHEFLDCDEVTGKYPYLGYIIEGNGVRIYHSGDTCIYPGYYEKLQELGPFDIMFIPINGRDAVRYKRNTIGNMTYQEAVDLVGSIKPGLAVPGHYEMFLLNSEDPNLFIDYLNVKYEGIKSWVGKHGEMVLYEK